MEEKQIIELYWNRSDDAIPQTKEKYGMLCDYIAQHILQNAEEAERCVTESYEMLWESIPPRRPQNLKGYLCKTTRNHALCMRYPELEEGEADLFLAELVIHDFLKGLEPEQRKLFIARYWYFSPVSEIAAQYTMREEKVNKTLLSLRQKLDSELEQKQIHLQTETELLYAMTEVEDGYLEEALPPMDVHEAMTETINPDTTNVFIQIWKKYQIPVMACVIFLVFVAFIWPKNPTNTNSTEGLAGSESQKEEPNTQGPEKTDIDLDNLITISDEGAMSQEDFEVRMKNLPWNEEIEIPALPIYKNLAYHSDAGYSVYFDEDALLAMAEDIAEKLNMDVISSQFMRTTTSEEPKNAIYEIQMTTDLGSIRISGRGEVYVSYTNGVKLSNGNVMSDEASIKEANETVTFLLQQYSQVLPSTNWVPNSYGEFYLIGNRSMHYQAVSSSYGINNILEYYFNQVSFAYDEELGMTGFRYGDVRMAAELLDYYPIISYEEAKELLLQGQYIEDLTVTSSPTIQYEDDIRGVELMYATSANDKYYQPYYCFYVEIEDTNFYDKCYVPAIKGTSLDGMPPEPEMEILDLEEYEHLDTLLYGKDGKYFTIENGAIKEIDQISFEDENKYGQAISEFTDNGIETFFYYKDMEPLNLSELMKDKNNVLLDARYIDGKILVMSIGSIDESNAQYITCYLYSQEDQSLTLIIEPTLLYFPVAQPNGLQFNGGRYATKGDSSGELVIVDVLTGSSVGTGIRFDDVEYVMEASESQYAIVYKTGEIAVMEKASGQLVKKTKAQIDFTPSTITYQDEMLYIETWNGKYLVFVISEFEV